MSDMRINAESLLNRRVRARNGKVVGRIQELRVQHRDNRYDVVEYVLGAGGLLERLAIAGGRVFGYRPEALVARWDQIDLTHATGPRLTCSRAELKTQAPPKRNMTY